MEQKIYFREMLSEIIALAVSQNNRLTVKEIDAFFAHTHLEKDKMELIYDYLTDQKIRIEGYEKGQELLAEALPEEEESGSPDKNSSAKPDKKKQYAYTRDTEGLERYVKEIGNIAQADPAEELKLFSLAVRGDAGARSSLIELYLPLVCELASTFETADYPVEDILQEGNVGLLLAVDSMEEQENLAAYQACLMNAVSRYMQEVLQEQKELREMGEGMVKRVNHLNEAIHNLEEDLEHKVSIEELSAYLEMPEEEIRDILKMAGDEIEIEDYGN